MEEHPTHWADTLMSSEFWMHSNKYELQLFEQKKARSDLTLHTRFPFNLGLEQGTGIPKSGKMPPTVERHQRHSISELSDSFRHQVSSRLREFATRAVTPEPRRSQDVWASSSTPFYNKQQVPISDGKALLPEWESCPSISSTASISSSVFLEPATPQKPMMGFHEASSWAGISRSKQTLGIDLFWPNLKYGVEFNCLKLEDLKPLCEFRNLRSLKITGMMQSYQSYIWQAVWLNRCLEELELSMILEPTIIAMRGQLIQEGWVMDCRENNFSIYYGDGDGELHPKFGYGEYLDKKSIEKAKIRAMGMGFTDHRLPIQKLTLSGFVVDADPFIQWFDPEKLKSVSFKGECIDAGLWFPPYMHVSIRAPKRMDLEAVPAEIVHVNVKSDVNVVNCTKSKI